MRGSFDKTGKMIKIGYGRWGFGIFALPALIVIALIGLARISPDMSSWISDAVQAEFNGTSGPETASTQLARPASTIQTVRAH